VQQIRIGSDRSKILVQLQLAADWLAPRGCSCAWNSFTTPRRISFTCNRCNCGCGIFENSLKQPITDLRFEISASRVSHFRGILRRTVRTVRPGAHQVLNRELKRKQWILQLMRQPTRQFAPSRDSLRLYQTFSLRQQFSRHRLNDRPVALLHRCREFRPRVPMPGATFWAARAIALPAAHPASRPTAQQDGQDNSATANQQRRCTDAPFQFDIRSPRISHEKNRQQWIVLAFARTAQRNRVKHFFKRGIGRPSYDSVVSCCAAAPRQSGARTCPPVGRINAVPSSRRIEERFRRKMITSIL